MNFIIYNSQGRILRTGQCSDADVLLQANEGEYVLQGIANQSTQYIVDGTVVDLPTKPDGEFYNFDYDLYQWVQDTATLAAKIVFERNKLLVNSDWTQLADVPLTNKAEWANYRQELRDIPEQQGYPVNVVWPVAPAS